jgi:hypothetical protein
LSTDVSELRAASINIALMMEASRTSETSVDNYFTQQYIPEDKSELHTRRRENLKSHNARILDLSEVRMLVKIQWLQICKQIICDSISI